MIKTFKDLQFQPHKLLRGAGSLPPYLREQYQNARQAIMDFDNGYGVSVIIGKCFYSNGIDTYELAVLKDGGLCYDTPVTDDVLGGLSEDEVTEAMKKLQLLK